MRLISVPLNKFLIMRFYQKGESLLEVVLALGIFSLMIAAITAMLTGGFGLSRISELSLQGNALAQEGIENTRSAHADTWNIIPYTQTTTETLGRFTRTTTYNAVCRTAVHEIATCPASYTDIHTKEAVVTVSWQDRIGITNSVRRATYLTNWESQDWTQTDWSGGAGQTIWNDTTKYDSSTSLTATSSPGTLRLGDAPDGQWYISGGSERTDTTDTQFNAGTLSDVVVNGSGENAGVTLEQGLQWAPHQNSASTTSSHLNAISLLSSTDIWASANNGEIIRYDGSSWSLNYDVGSAHLNGIAMRTTSDGWAVGQSGKIYHYNGTAWSESADSGNDVWFDIASLASNDVWVVGSDDDEAEDDGKIAHYNGSVWSYVTPPSDHVIYGVAAVSPTDMWAAGKSGRIWRYNGVSWSLQTDTGSETWNDIVLISANDGWVAGKSGAVAHWNGSAWTVAAVPSPAEIKSLDAISSTDIWAVGQNGNVWHYNGSAWEYRGTAGSDKLNNITMINAQTGWAVGNNGRIELYGLLLYDATGTYQSTVVDTGTASPIWSVASWVETLVAGGNVTIATRTGATPAPDGSWSSWSGELTQPNGSQITSPSARYLQYRISYTRGDNPTESPRVDAVTIQYNLATSANLYSIAALSSSDVWAAGASGKIIHFDGTGWAEYADTGNETWYAMDFRTPIDGWVGGISGSVAHWNGSSWSDSSVPSAADIRAIAAVAVNDVWAAGLSGRIWHYDGLSWTLFIDTGNTTWRTLAFSSANDIWAGGDSGALAHWDGSSWSTSTIPSPDTIYGMTAVSSSDMWAVGANGKIWNYNGSSWSLHTDTGSQQWLGSAFPTSFDGWAIGGDGAIRRYNDTAWSSFSSPTAEMLSAVSFASRKLGWAVGDDGMVLRFYRESVSVMSGSLQSSAFSMSDASPIQTIEWTDVSTDCSSPCKLQFQLRAAPDAGGSPGTWSDWYGANGTSTYFTVPNGSLVPTALNGKQWVQYRAEFISDGTSTPILSDVTVNYQ